MERESQHRLLQTVVENTSSPLICFEEDAREIYFINNAAKNLFQVPFMQKINSVGRIDSRLLQAIKEIKDGERLTEKLVVNGKASMLSMYAQHVLFEKQEP